MTDERIELSGEALSWDKDKGATISIPIREVIEELKKHEPKVLEELDIHFGMKNTFCTCEEPKARANQDWQRLDCRVCGKPIKPQPTSNKCLCIEPIMREDGFCKRCGNAL